jgi:hypothetical protein
MLPVIILTIGILSRLIWHLPNFTPVYALALFGGAYLDRRLSVVLPVALMMISDAIIGFYPGIVFTWIGMALIACLGWRLRETSARARRARPPRHMPTSRTQPGEERGSARASVGPLPESASLHHGVGPAGGATRVGT